MIKLNSNKKDRNYDPKSMIFMIINITMKFSHLINRIKNMTIKITT